jgi:transposase-like protein
MTGKQNSAKKLAWKEMLAEQEDFLRPLVQEIVQQVLEAEMEETLGAEKGESARRTGKDTDLATTRERW